VLEEAEQTLQRTREVGSLTLAASLAAELGVTLTASAAKVVGSPKGDNMPEVYIRQPQGIANIVLTKARHEFT
jgi:hypothetical protein